jgi:hypothetical protein
MNPESPTVVTLLVAALLPQEGKVLAERNAQSLR